MDKTNPPEAGTVVTLGGDGEAALNEGRWAFWVMFSFLTHILITWVCSFYSNSPAASIYYMHPHACVLYFQSFKTTVTIP